MPLFLLKNAWGPRYKAFYIFFVIPLRGHFYPSRNEKNSPKPEFSVYIYAYPTKYAGSKNVYGNFTFMTHSIGHKKEYLVKKETVLFSLIYDGHKKDIGCKRDYTISVDLCLT